MHMNKDYAWPKSDGKLLEITPILILNNTPFTLATVTYAIPNWLSGMTDDGPMGWVRILDSGTGYTTLLPGTNSNLCQLSFMVRLLEDNRDLLTDIRPMPTEIIDVFTKEIQKCDRA